MAIRKARLSLFVLVFVTVVAVGVIAVTSVLAAARMTPPDGLAATPIVSGTLLEPVQAVFSSQIQDSVSEATEASGEAHSSSEVAVSTISLTKYEVEPGGSFGWHQHGGPVWVVIESGELTIYDETCGVQVYPPGSALLDYGNHTHIGINEANEPLQLYVVFMLPEEGEPRLDIEQPTGCSV